MLDRSLNQRRIQIPGKHVRWNVTAQKMKFYIKDIFIKFDQIRRKLRTWGLQLNWKGTLLQLIRVPLIGELRLVES